MRDWKKAASVLLALSPLFLGALLPVFVGMAQDVTQQPGVAQLPPISLTLEEKKELTLTDKLTILRGGDRYYLDEETYHTEKTLEYSIQEGLNPYYYRELIPYNWADVTVDAYAYLLYNPEYPEISFPVWEVNLHLSDCRVELTVDDETGNILHIHFMGSELLETYTMQGYLSEIMDAWYESLGIDAKGWELRGETVEETYARASCVYTDASYGELVVEFYVWDTGFWIY